MPRCGRIHEREVDDHAGVGHGRDVPWNPNIPLATDIWEREWGRLQIGILRAKLYINEQSTIHIQFQMESLRKDEQIERTEDDIMMFSLVEMVRAETLCGGSICLTLTTGNTLSERDKVDPRWTPAIPQHWNISLIPCCHVWQLEPVSTLYPFVLVLFAVSLTHSKSTGSMQ